FCYVATSIRYSTHLSLHDALPILLVSTVPLADIQILSWDSTVFCAGDSLVLFPLGVTGGNGVYTYAWRVDTGAVLSTADTLLVGDRKSTRLNSSHVKISYAGFCLI